MTETAGRRPSRLDFGTSPRLVAVGPHDSTPADAARWRAQTELILNAAGEGIYGLDLKGHCTFVNPAAASMTGHSVEELLGQPMHDVVHHSHANGDLYPRKDCPIYAAFVDGMVRNVGDECFFRKDGSSFPVEYTSTPIFNGPKLVGAVVVFRDISRRHQTEDRLRGALSEVQRLKERLQLENTNLRQEIERTRGLQGVVGNSSVLQETMRLVRRAATTDSTILIQGETGTGKELIAQTVHRLSQRSAGPMIRINCGAISPQLADSELFGHEKGAFTGAQLRRAGRFEQAHGGTLFLDEVGELPLETQSKLLRVLQEREFERVGGNTTLRADVRVVAATNRDLKTLVKHGAFRADLYFRLNVVPVNVPPLRERPSDIPALVERFLRQLEMRLGRTLGNVSEATLNRLTSYHWPGNVRELQNGMERAAILSDGEHVEVPQELLAFGDESRASTLAGVNPLPSSIPAAATLPETERTTPESDRFNLQQERAMTLEAVEREHILRVLESTRWRLSGASGASAILGLHPNTLRHRMKKLGIQR